MSFFLVLLIAGVIAATGFFLWRIWASPPPPPPGNPHVLVMIRLEEAGTLAPLEGDLSYTVHRTGGTANESGSTERFGLYRGTWAHSLRAHEKITDLEVEIKTEHCAG